MGTMISLGVGKMEIDWGENNVFTDHSVLFKVDMHGKWSIIRQYV